MSAPFAWIAVSFILGILAISFVNIPFLFLAISAVICLIAVILSLNKSRASGASLASAGVGPVLVGINPFNSAFLLLLVFLTGCLCHTLTGTGKNNVEFPPFHIRNFLEEEPSEVVVKGVISNDPCKKEDGYGGFYCSYLFKLDKVRKSGVWQKVSLKGWLRLSGTAMVTVSGAAAEYEYGDELIMKGKISSVPGPTNSGQFDYARYLARQKIYAVFKVKDERNIIAVGKNRLNPIIKFGFSIRQKLSRSIEQYLPREQAGLLSAMLLGRRQDLAGDLKDTFVQTGTVHLLAISGLHTGLIVAFFLIILKLLRVKRKASYLITIGLVILYCFISGSRVPVKRAAIMAVIWLLGMVLDRDARIYNSLGLTALILLFLNPGQLFDAGFQLSFITVISILYLAPRVLKFLLALDISWTGFKLLLRRFKTFHHSNPPNPPLLKGGAGGLLVSDGPRRQRRDGSFQKIKFYLFSLFSASLAAWLGTIPLTLHYFNLFSPVTVLSNIFAIPLLFLIIASGLTFGITSLLGIKFFIVIFANTCWFLLSGLGKLTLFLSGLPLSHFYIGRTGIPFLIFYYGLLIIVIERRRLKLSFTRLGIILFIILNIFVWTRCLQTPRDVLSITFLDVGHGDSAFIRFPESGNMLLDGGKGGGADKGRKIVMPYLLFEGVNKIDAVISTHPENDHIGGLVTIIKNLKVRYLFDNGVSNPTFIYRKYRDAISNKRIPYRVVREGEKLEGYRGVKIYILYPPIPLLKGTPSDVNNNSVVLKIVYGKVSILLCGDIEEEAMLDLLDYGENLKSTIIKVPHHGSRIREKGGIFLKAVQAETAIISVGKGRQGLPSEKTLDCLKKLNIKTYQTPTSGAITIETDGEDYKISTFLN